MKDGALAAQPFNQEGIGVRNTILVNQGAFRVGLTFDIHFVLDGHRYAVQHPQGAALNVPLFARARLLNGLLEERMAEGIDDRLQLLCLSDNSVHQFDRRKFFQVEKPGGLNRRQVAQFTAHEWFSPSKIRMPGAADLYSFSFVPDRTPEPAPREFLA
jgi:hypothetical protein